MANDKLMLILMLAAEIHQRQGLIGDGQNRISAAKDPKALASSVAARARPGVRLVELRLGCNGGVDLQTAAARSRAAG